MILWFPADKDGYNELFSDGYNPSHDDLDLHLSDDEDDSTVDSKNRDSSGVNSRSR